MHVFINDLTFKAILGILDFERIKKQTVIVDIDFEYTYKKNQFIDYSKVAKMVETTMKKKKFKLIEDAIECLHKKLTKKFKIKNLAIKISKPTILKNCNVSVQG
ncbi:MAG: dihydroneopterin aldolase [Campylobacterota bacterium]|nr:dihydroneopterin aldolase [Campylobacterota bacterium]